MSLKLSAEQADKIQSIEIESLSNIAQLQEQLTQLKLKHVVLMMSKDLPDEAEVLAQSRLVSSQRGTIVEACIKAHLRIRQVLTQEQRKELRLRRLDTEPKPILCKGPWIEWWKEFMFPEDYWH